MSASHIRLLCEAGAGDEVLAVFASARCALQCAVALQAAFRQVTAGDISLPFPEGIGLDAGQADIERVVDAHPTFLAWMSDVPTTVRDCLLHAGAHSALHQGHIEMTCQ